MPAGNYYTIYLLFTQQLLQPKTYQLGLKTNKFWGANAPIKPTMPFTYFQNTARSTAPNISMLFNCSWTSLQKTWCPERIVCLGMCNGIHRESSKPGVTERIWWVHHQMLLLWQLLVGRLEWAKGVGLLLGHCRHLNRRRGSNTVGHCKYILYFKWIWGCCSIGRLLGSICSFIIQTVQSEGVQSTSLTFINRNASLRKEPCTSLSILWQPSNIWSWSQDKTEKEPTNCRSLAEEILVLGVLTSASSHPVGSKSFVRPAPELNVGAVAPAAKGQHLVRIISNQKFTEIGCGNTQMTKKRKATLPGSDGTIARAKALLSSIADASGAAWLNPWTHPKKKMNIMTDNKGGSSGWESKGATIRMNKIDYQQITGVHVVLRRSWWSRWSILNISNGNNIGRRCFRFIVRHISIFRRTFFRSVC